ncbi:MAG: hypothetical protein DSZ06_03985 [Sulfurospirillum sp.]|nr:MAG: hypothetical protein DSZ06_03985 [Sulfurospirillum sp.]
MAVIVLSGCDGDVEYGSGSMSSNDSKKIGSLSGGEDLQELLRAKKWDHITIDLDQYRYQRSSNPKSYDIDMNFGTKTVEGLANCQRFSANYRVKDDELSFSRVHFEPASDLAVCKEYPYADEAVNTFFSDSFILHGVNNNKLSLESQEYETTIILTR